MRWLTRILPQRRSLSEGVALDFPAVPRQDPLVLTESVIGNDNRVPVHSIKSAPWCAVVFLECTFANNKKFAGTGWLINPRTIITAGHNLWNPPFDAREPNRAVGEVKA